MKGVEVTPFVLKRVAEISGGESLRSNIHLVKNNARVGADIALELSRIKNGSGNKNGSGKKRVVIMGGECEFSSTRKQ